MRRRLAVVAAVIAFAAIGAAAVRAQAPAPRAVGAPASLAEQTRYIGRDPYSGDAVTVGDQFIAAVAESYETYYDEDREPEPPPPAAGVDVTSLTIPALGVDAAIARYGLDAAGRLDVPQDASTVGWNPAYTGLPGEGRSTFLAAHYEYGGAPGVFFELSSLRSGDEVMVTLSDGSEHRYRVTSVLDYALEAIDMGALLAGREGVESLTLMTCSGPGDGGRYPLRTVVLAEAVAGS